MKIWCTMFDESNRQVIQTRLRSLKPNANRQWGRMSAPQMVAHLTDQMHHSLGDSSALAKPGLLRWPPVRYTSIYLVPWPKGRIKGPPEAFTTQPTTWEHDVSELEALVERFAARDPKENWPDHALFGHMSGRDWGVFVHKHFDHHLRQFGS